MSVAFKGGTAATSVPPKSRLRATWRWTLAGSLNPLGTALFNAPDIAEKVRDALPSQGYIPASLPSAAPGDEVIVYNVTVSVQQPSLTLAQHAQKLDATPVSSLLGGRIVELVALELLAVAKDTTSGGTTFTAPGGGTAPTNQQMQDGLAETRSTEQKSAETDNLLNDAKNAAGSFLDELKEVLGALAIPLGIVVVGGIAYFAYKSGAFKK